MSAERIYVRECAIYLGEECFNYYIKVPADWFDTLSLEKQNTYLRKEAYKQVLEELDIDIVSEKQFKQEFFINALGAEVKV